jgi:hypothetical protein
MNAFSDEDLRSYLRLNRKPLAELSGDDEWWGLGPLQVSKKHATFRAGFSHPILATTRFVLQEFEVSEKKGCAVVLLSGGKPPAYFAGWVPMTRVGEAARWTDVLNETIQSVLRQAADPPPSSGAESANVVSTVRQPAIDRLTCSFGHEWAPDAPWGEEVIQLTRGGAVDYVRRQRGEELQHVRGRVASIRFSEVAAMLANTRFPEAPEQFFPPGASVCTILAEPPTQKMDISYFGGLRLQGYCEFLRTLQSLCSAFRESGVEELARWRFEPVG